MIKTDYHMHTCYSFDSNEKMEDIVKQSIEIGLTEIVFTDHLETIEPGTGIDSIIDYDEYIREIEDLRHRYGKDINIMLGAEINLEPSIEKETNEYLSRYPFDFIIGSLHASDFTDFAMSDISRGLTQDEYYSKYLFLQQRDGVRLYEHQRRPVPQAEPLFHVLQIRMDKSVCYPVPVER